jgi:hypothetical protein
VWKKNNLSQSYQEQEYHRPDRSTNQRSDQSVKGQLQKARQRAPNQGAYDSYDHIDDQTGSFPFHNSFSQETGYNPYYQESDQGFNLQIYSHVFLLPHYCVLLDEQSLQIIYTFI